MKDYHGVLGVSKDADEKEIRRAYRRLALLFHPDRNKNKDAEAKFKEINEAYAVLSGKEKTAEEPARYPVETWDQHVVRIWEEILNKEHDNAYR